MRVPIDFTRTSCVPAFMHDFDRDVAVPLWGLRKFRVHVKFSPECIYEWEDGKECGVLGIFNVDSPQGDWNKGPGIRFKWYEQFKNTVMLGWRGDRGTGKIELSPYYHRPDRDKTPQYIGRKTTEPCQTTSWDNNINDGIHIGAMLVEPDEWFWYEVEWFNDTCNQIAFRMTFQNGATYDGMPADPTFVDMPQTFLTGWWFGGNCPAPHRMCIDWYVEPAAPATSTGGGGGYGNDTPPYML